MKKIFISCLLLLSINTYAAGGFNEYEEIDPECSNCVDSSSESKKDDQIQKAPCAINNVVGRDMCTQPVEAKSSIKANKKQNAKCCNVLIQNHPITITVTGQGVAPVNTISPAQAYALAKRAAIADAYRLIAEKVRGVEVEGEDLIKNMMVKRSTVRTTVYALVRNANITETTFRDGLCEVEMEIKLYYEDFVR